MVDPQRPSARAASVQMRFPAERVVQVVRLLEDGGVPVWIDGGWAIDALLKKETREHLDLDLMVPLDNLPAAEAILGAAGFTKDVHRTYMPTRFIVRSSEGLQIDIHPVTFRPDGSAVHIGPEPSEISAYVYPAAGLSGVGVIHGRVVHCISAAEQIRQKAEGRYYDSPWSPSRARASGVSADLEDIISLLQVLGTKENVGPLEAGPSESPVVGAAEQFRLRHVATLNAQHSQLTAEHARLIAEHARLTAQLSSMQASAWQRLFAPLRRKASS